MTTPSKFKGHDIEKKDGKWFFCKSGRPVKEYWKETSCGHCGENNTKEGHDACLGELPGVENACCGHGVEEEAYLQCKNGTFVQGTAVRVIVNMLKDLIKGERV